MPTIFFPLLLFMLRQPQHVQESDWKDREIRNAGMTAAAVLAPGRRPLTVGKPVKIYC